MDTKTITATATDGTQVTLQVPTILPSQERATILRQIFNLRVHSVDTKNWKTQCVAIVPESLASETAEAMEFMGCIVDYRRECAPVSKFQLTLRDGPHRLVMDELPGHVVLFSRGYYHHIGA